MLVLAVAAIIGSTGATVDAAEGALGLCQQPDLPYLKVAPTIVAEPGSEVDLPINVGPQEALPQRTFLGLWGLPPTVGLTEGRSVGPGSWAVPVAVLPRTKIVIPQGLSAHAEVVVNLIGINGKLIAQAKTTLVVGSAPLAKPADNPDKAPKSEKKGSAAASPTPEQPKGSAAAMSQPPTLSAEERARAEELVAQGNRYLAQGKVAAARLFFRQAADANFAPGAMRLAATYDPVELTAMNVLGVSPDLIEARKWYERARELGASEAEQRLVSLLGK